MTEGAELPGGFVLLRLAGEIDVAGCRALDRRIRDSAERLIVDLSEVGLLSAAAIGVLIAHTERLAALGGRLLVVGSESVARILRTAQADTVLDTYDSLAEALQAAAPGAAAATEYDGQRLRLRPDEVVRLRRQLRTVPTVARAIGVLQERYGLPDDAAAFDLLRVSSQRHNLRLYRVAAALLAAPAPRRRDTERWFPGRLRRPAPPLPFLGDALVRTGNRTAVLDAVLAEMAGRTETESADLQLSDALDGGLRLDRQRGLTAELVELVDTADYARTAPTLALRRRVRTVVDLAEDPVFADSVARAMLLAGGSRTVRSAPMFTSAGSPVGVITTHHAERAGPFDPATRAALTLIADQTGAWLDWHQRTVMLDALELVHRSARLR